MRGALRAAPRRVGAHRRADQPCPSRLVRRGDDRRALGRRRMTTHRKETGMTVMPNEVHQSIAMQIDSMKPDHLRPGLDIGMEPIDETTLRIILPAKRAYVDVRYDRGPHTYTVTATARAPLGATSVLVQRDPISDVYCDQLGEMVFGEDAKEWSLPFG